MTTPTAEQIREKAQELFFRENATTITPEDSELRESGYWNQARDELMRGESTEMLTYVEELAHDVGRRLVTEEDHDRLIDIERQASRLKEKEKLDYLKSELERMKEDFDSKDQRPPVTVEKIITEIKWRTRKRRKKQIIEKTEEVAKKQGLSRLATLKVLATVLELDDLDLLSPMVELAEPLKV